MTILYKINWIIIVSASQKIVIFFIFSNIQLEFKEKNGSIINVGVDTHKEWSTPNIFDIKK